MGAATAGLVLLLLVCVIYEIAAARHLSIYTSRPADSVLAQAAGTASSPHPNWLLWDTIPWHTVINYQHKDAVSSWLSTGPLSAHPAAADNAADTGGMRKLLPLDGRDYALLAVLFVSLALAGGAGIGGGAILVPALILIEGFPTTTAVALSNITILGGAAANFICNVRRRRPNGLPVIDWDLIMMMEPTTIVGALVGGYLNKFLPAWITTLLLTLMLFLMAARLYSKGRQTFSKETQLICQLKAHTPKHQHHGAPPPAAASAAQAVPGSDEALRQPLLAQDHLVDGQEEAAAGLDAADRTADAEHKAAAQHRAAAAASSVQHQAAQRGTAGAQQAGHIGKHHLKAQSTPSSVPSAASRPHSFPGDSASMPVPRALQALRNAAAGRGRPPVSGPGSFVDSFSPRLGSGVYSRGGSAGRRRLERLHSITRREERGSYSRVEAMQLFQGEAMDVQQPVVHVADHTSSSGSEDSSDEEDASTAAAAAAAAAPGTSNSLLVATAAAAAAAAVADAPRSAAAGLCNADQDPPALVVKVAIVDGTAKRSKRHITPSAATARIDSTSIQAAHEAQPAVPVLHLLGLLLLSGWVVASDFAKAAVTCGTPLYWLATASLLVPVVAVTVAFRAYLLRKHAGHAFNPEEGELRWTPTTTLLYPALCSFAGLVAGLFGIGGGVVKGPLMLELGVLPEVAAATSATMIAFTAGSACVVYSRFGGILWDYAAMLLGVGFCVTLMSQLVTFYLVKLLGRRSIIIFMMVALMSLATLVMVWESAVLVPQLAAHPEELWHFGSICPRPKHS